MISVETINSRHSDILLRVFLSLLLPQKLPDKKYFWLGSQWHFIMWWSWKTAERKLWILKQILGMIGTSSQEPVWNWFVKEMEVISRLLPSQNVWTGFYGTPRLFSEVFLLLHYKFLNHQFHCWLERVRDLLGQSVCLSVWMSMSRV